MKRRERQRRMQWLFDEGLSRQEIFERYREEVGEEKQDQVAFDVASLVDTQRRREHIGKIRITAPLV